MERVSWVQVPDPLPLGVEVVFDGFVADLPHHEHHELRDCRVFWGSHGCRFERGHADRQHRCSDGCPPPAIGLMFGEDTTPDERAEMD